MLSCSLESSCSAWENITGGPLFTSLPYSICRTCQGPREPGFPCENQFLLVHTPLSSKVWAANLTASGLGTDAPFPGPHSPCQTDSRCSTLQRWTQSLDSPLLPPPGRPEWMELGLHPAWLHRISAGTGPFGDQPERLPTSGTLRALACASISALTMAPGKLQKT